jgi:hypothetical protein
MHNPRAELGKPAPMERHQTPAGLYTPEHKTKDKHETLADGVEVIAITPWRDRAGDSNTKGECPPRSGSVQRDCIRTAGTAWT